MKYNAENECYVVFPLRHGLGHVIRRLLPQTHTCNLKHNELVVSPSGERVDFQWEFLGNVHATAEIPNDHQLQQALSIGQKVLEAAEKAGVEIPDRSELMECEGRGLHGPVERFCWLGFRCVYARPEEAALRKKIADADEGDMVPMSKAELKLLRKMKL